MTNNEKRLLAVLKEMVQLITSGRHYQSQNPYTRPEVKRSMKLAKEIEGYSGDWQDVFDILREEKDLVKASK